MFCNTEHEAFDGGVLDGVPKVSQLVFIGELFVAVHGCLELAPERGPVYQVPVELRQVNFGQLHGLGANRCWRWCDKNGDRWLILQ